MLLLNSFFEPQMEELHPDICALKHLNQITANGMGIVSIPTQVNNLQDLKILSLNNNQIASLPEEICELGNLKTLNLNKNALTKLPDNIGNLTSLNKLNLKGNNIPATEQARIEKALPDCKIKF
ncbi:MAG: leucine-rich repeat domain-containing protein [Cyclobacteriaceae bacterium]